MIKAVNFITFVLLSVICAYMHAIETASGYLDFSRKVDLVLCLLLLFGCLIYIILTDCIPLVLPVKKV